MNLKTGISKNTVIHTLGRPAVYRAVALALALIAASSVAVSAAKVSEPVLKKDTPMEGVGRSESTIQVWCETDTPLPEWWDPENAEIVWEDKDLGCPDWNLNTSLTAWNGALVEEWEIDLFARVFYKEFWGASDLCCEVGCDAMLNLWASGETGRTLGESMWAVNDFGKYVYSVYPYLWAEPYDTDGLVWCRELCESRLITGPSYEAAYFQLGGFHGTDWSTPCFEIDGVYFSTFKK